MGGLIYSFKEQINMHILLQTYKTQATRFVSPSGFKKKTNKPIHLFFLQIYYHDRF